MNMDFFDTMISCTHPLYQHIYTGHSYWSLHIYFSSKQRLHQINEFLSIVFWNFIKKQTEK